MKPSERERFLYGIDPKLPYEIHLRYPVKASRNEASPRTKRIPLDSPGPKWALPLQHPVKLEADTESSSSTSEATFPDA